jgi:hypothetical protein
MTVFRLEGVHGSTSWSFEQGKDTIVQGITRFIDEVDFDTIPYVGERRQ